MSAARAGLIRPWLSDGPPAGLFASDFGEIESARPERRRIGTACPSTWCRRTEAASSPASANLRAGSAPVARRFEGR